MKDSRSEHTAPNEETKEYTVQSILNEVLSDDDDVRIYKPQTKEAEEELRRQATRVIELTTHGAVKTEPDEAELADAGLDGQLFFEGMEEADEPELRSAEQESALEEQLQDARREKVENFRLIEDENSGLRFSGTEAEEAPAAGDEMEDYNSYAESAAVRAELHYRRRSGAVSLLVAGMAEFLLLCIMILSETSPVLPMEPITYLTLNVVLSACVMLAAHRVMSDGVGGLVRLHATADSITAIAAFAAEIHAALQYMNLTEVSNGEITLYNAVAGLALFLALCGRQYRIARICRNFRFVSYKGDKYAVLTVEDPKQQERFGRFVPAVSAPEVAYLKKAGFLSHFMANSYDDEGHETLFCWFSPVLIGFSLLFSVVFMLLGGESANWWSAVSVFTALLCISAPAFAVAGANLSLCRVGKKLLQRGAMLVGWKAVDAMEKVNALTVDASDLFPGETMLLHGIKTFSGARIDEAILDAAAVTIKAGGPLAGVLRRVIENRTDMLEEVDTLLYEQEMGLSGWVGGRRVLVGNRRLLENHGVDVPSRDYEMRYTKDGRQLVYLSTGGELCAMFVVSYTADKSIAQALDSLSRAGVTLLIRTCDPNVTQELVRDVFRIDEDTVRILDAMAGRVYETLNNTTQERCEAVLACNGRLEGLGMALGICHRLRRRVKAAGILQMIGAQIGFLLMAVAIVIHAAFSPVVMVVHLLLWSAITWLVTSVYLK